MGIKKNNGQKVWEVQEGIIGKFLSILGSSLLRHNNSFCENFSLHMGIIIIICSYMGSCVFIVNKQPVYVYGPILLTGKILHADNYYNLH